MAHKPTIAKDTPLAELTLRKYEKPTSSGRDLVRKVCLTLGLLQPGDSRDVVVDVLHVMLKNKRGALTSKEVELLVIENRKDHGVPLLGIAPSNIRRQLLRCRELFLVEKIKATYRITENALFSEIFAEKLESYYLNSIMQRVKEYMSRVDQEFLK